MKKQLASSKLLQAAAEALAGTSRREGPARYFAVEELGEDVEFGNWFSIDDEIDSCSVEWNLELMEKHLPPNTIPVGCSSTGDLILLQVANDGSPHALLFWDLVGPERRFDGDTTYSLAADVIEFERTLAKAPKNGRGVDSRKANRGAGYASTPLGHTWHYDKGTPQMLLVPSEVHRKTYFS